MRRQITTHQVNDVNTALTITVMDAPDDEGQCHDYIVTPQGWHACQLHFSRNVTDEVLLAILLDRWAQGVGRSPMHYRLWQIICEAAHIRRRLIKDRNVAINSYFPEW